MRLMILASFAPSLVNFRGPLISHYVKEGHEVHTCAPDIDPAFQAKIKALGATTHSIHLQRTKTGFLSDIRYLLALRQLMRRVQPDLVLTYTIKPNIWGAFAASSLGIRSAAMVTGLGYAFTDTDQTGWKTKFVRRVARFLYRAATARNWRVIFQNPNDRDDFIAAGCLIDSSKVRMVNGSGVDLDHYPAAPNPDTPDFLMISRILGAKGVREYAQAATAVKQTHPAARFRLVGFIDHGPDAIDQAELDGWVADGLEYLGPSDDVRPHLADCRIYVLPSYREGTPRSVLEAMATGRAILTSDAPGCRETVEDGVNGFLVPVRDADTLADKMRWMIDNPDRCERMAEESLRMVREKYDVNKVNEVLMDHLGFDK